jgi:ketosteroid isomerase-like protein
MPSARHEVILAPDVNLLARSVMARKPVLPHDSLMQRPAVASAASGGIKMNGRNARRMVLGLMTTALALGAAPPNPEQAIESTAEAYRKAVLAGDAAAVSATYRDDAMEMPPSQPPLRGRAAIGQYYRERFAGPAHVVQFTFTRIETAAAGDIGYSTGTFKQKLVLQTGQAIECSGTYVVVVRRDAGVWKSQYVMYNEDRPRPTL